MTSVTTDHDALLRAVLENPADDAPRLIYADWLEENDLVSEIPCPTCTPYLEDPDRPYSGPGYHPARDPASGRHEGGWTNCKRCNCGGPDYIRAGIVREANRLRERAEFIRVQVELATALRSLCRACGQPLRDDRTADGCPCNSPRGVNHGIVPDYVCTCKACDPQETGSVRKQPNNIADLHKRERELLTCHGGGWVPPCLSNTLGHKWAWSRGFLIEVHLTCEQFVGLAAALFAAHPIEQVVLTDRQPYQSPTDGRWVWLRGDDGVHLQPYYLPLPLFNVLRATMPDWMRDDARSVWSVVHSSPIGDAMSALSAACVRYGRGLAGLGPITRS